MKAEIKIKRVGKKMFLACDCSDTALVNVLLCVFIIIIVIISAEGGGFIILLFY